MHVVLSTRGRFTLPIEVRRNLRLKGGDFVEFEMRDDGNIVVRRAKAQRKSAK